MGAARVTSRRSLVFEAAFLAVACVRHRMTLGASRRTPTVIAGAATLPPAGEPANG